MDALWIFQADRCQNNAFKTRYFARRFGNDLRTRYFASTEASVTQITSYKRVIRCDVTDVCQDGYHWQFPLR